MTEQNSNNTSSPHGHYHIYADLLNRNGEASAGDAMVRKTPSLDPCGLKILFVASECAPYAKSGGLGDVVAALPKTLKKMGCDVRIILPLYDGIDRLKYGISYEGSACVHMGHGEENWVGVHQGLLDQQVPVWFVDYDRFFHRPGIYDEPFGEYKDNAYRFALLSKAALQICKDRQFIPNIIHAHDWPSALTCVFLKTWDKVLSPLSSTASVLTIHNIGHQGVYDPSVFSYIGVGDEYYNGDVFEDHGNVNLLKAGIAFTDAITTVSPRHAKELLEPLGGRGLAMFLNNRKSDLFGILNGTDYEHWNPEHDALIPACYSVTDVSGKEHCKQVLQERFGLEQNKTKPVFGVVTRFVEQKGIGLMKEAFPRVMNTMDVQLVILGSGDRDMENFVWWLSNTYPGRVGSFVGYSNELSHLIEAGSDFFIMPSLYEPCGLNQIYSLTYGTLPVVRATGGLDDTVINYNEEEGEGTGFKFYDPTVEALYNTIGWAVATWYDRPGHVQRMRRRAMQQKFSWDDSALCYLEVYAHALRNRQQA